MQDDIKFTSDITVRLIQSVGGDHMVIAAARVSTSGEDVLQWVNKTPEDNYGLINYLMKSRHGTPFEHGCLTFFIHAPVFVWWEWVRHRVGFSPNLESGRYKVLDPVFWVPRQDRKMIPDEGHKSARPKFKQADKCVWEREVARNKKLCVLSYQLYKEAIADGVCNEVARAKLPFSVYYSGWMTCNPRSLMAFLSLRTHEATAKFVSYPQAEIEEAARQCEEMLKQGWPLTYKAFCANGRVGP